VDSAHKHVSGWQLGDSRRCSAGPWPATGLGTEVWIWFQCPSRLQVLKFNPHSEVLRGHKLVRQDGI
jgi:hypothetical protein